MLLRKNEKQQWYFRRRQWHPTPVLLPGKSHGRRNLVAAVHGVAKSQTRLNNFTFTFMHWRRKWQPLQCSCLENPRDGGAWGAAIYGVTQSRTRLKWLSSSSSSSDALSGKWWIHLFLVDGRFSQQRRAGLLIRLYNHYKMTNMRKIIFQNSTF